MDEHALKCLKILQEMRNEQLQLAAMSCSALIAACEPWPLALELLTAHHTAGKAPRPFSFIGPVRLSVTCAA